MLNPKAVLDYYPCCASKRTDSSSQNSTTPMKDCAGNHHASVESSGNVEDAADESFTAEEEVFYNTIYTEGYNVHDPKLCCLA